jgi:hypothetical protein
MQAWESLVFATIAATFVTFLFLWVLHYAFKKAFSSESAEFPDTVMFGERRKMNTFDTLLAKICIIEEKIVAIEKKLNI